jgi:hypothetical protein
LVVLLERVVELFERVVEEERLLSVVDWRRVELLEEPLRSGITRTGL